MKRNQLTKGRAAQGRDRGTPDRHSTTDTSGLLPRYDEKVSQPAAESGPPSAALFYVRVHPSLRGFECNGDVSTAEAAAAP